MTVGISIQPPTEGATWAGYWHLELTRDGEVVVDLSIEDVVGDAIGDVLARALEDPAFWRAQAAAAEVYDDE